MTTAFLHVFSPFRIGGVELRNRIFVPAHTTNYGVDHLPARPPSLGRRGKTGSTSEKGLGTRLARGRRQSSVLPISTR
jgi:hypothetical protein